MRPILFAALAVLATACIPEAFADASTSVAATVGSEIAAGPLGSSEIAKGRGEPIGLMPDGATPEFDTNTVSVGTSAAALIAEVALANRVATYVQNLKITNRHASQTVCVWFKAVLASDCATRCAASPLTCNLSTTDGDPIAPGGIQEVPLQGTMCACAIASGAATTTTTARTQRSGRPQ